MERILRALFLAGVAFAVAPTASAQANAPADRQVTGFRSARFGMNADEVRAAIARDFKAGPELVAELDNPTEQTKILVVTLASMEPGPGPAKVSYILGATTKRLIHVNVVWTTGDTPTEDERNRMAAAGVLLTNYFRAETWKGGQTQGGIMEGKNDVLLFGGIDARGAAVEVHLSGVTLSMEKGPGPAPTGPAYLRIAYLANAKKADVATVRSGTF